MKLGVKNDQEGVFPRIVFTILKRLQSGFIYYGSQT